MILVKDVSLVFGDRVLLDQVSFAVRQGEKVALIGRNGAGKSTLLKMIAGHGEPDSGSIDKPINMAYLKQEITLDPELTVMEAAYTAFERVRQIHDQLEKTIYQLEHHHDNEESLMHHSQMMAELYSELEHLDEANIEGDMEKVLKGLGFEEDTFHKKLKELSGGWQMRVELAKLLLARPDYLLLDELMAYNSDTVSTRPDSLAAGSSGVILVPTDLDMRFTTDIRALDYNKLNIKSVKGEVLIKEGVLKMKETGFKLVDAVTVMNGSYRTLSSTRASFTYNIKIDSFDVKKMYNEVELFRQLVPAASKAEGIVSLDYNLEGKLDGNMYPIMPSLKGGGDLAVQKVKLNGFKLFSAISKETGKEAMNDPELKKIHFKTTIKNNVVTLEKTKIKVKGYRLRIQGQTSFDGSIKFDCRLGLPPFGIVGIPIRATGTGQDPKIKVGKTDKLPLKEQKEEKEDTTDPGSKK